VDPDPEHWSVHVRRFILSSSFSVGCFLKCLEIICIDFEQPTLLTIVVPSLAMLLRKYALFNAYRRIDKILDFFLHNFSSAVINLLLLVKSLSPHVLQFRNCAEKIFFTMSALCR
jgi:hypothetical protein